VASRITDLSVVDHSVISARTRGVQGRLARARTPRFPTVEAADDAAGAAAAARWEVFPHTSAALADNPLGDPAVRPLAVYLPPGYDEGARTYPSLYVTHGYTGMIERHWNVEAYQTPFPQMVEDQFARPGQAPAIVVFTDAFTALGGSQYLDSPAVGRYHTWLCDEVVAEVDRRYRTSGARGIAGKSSGGYGALVSALLRPDLFQALASHAGDCLFEVQFLPLFREAARALRDEYDGSFERFFESFFSRIAFTRDSDGLLLELYGMAACFSAQDDATVRLPFDPATGRLIPEVWTQWLGHDPVRMVEQSPEAAKTLRAVWLDAGRRDDYYLDLGAEALRRALLDAGGPDPNFELLDADHRSWELDYRYPIALGWLAEQLG
jgi:hypothetical protein